MVPIDRPGKIICVGLNYKDHAEEQGVDLPKAPLFFAKYTTSLIGPGDPIVIPSVVEQCDYEAELGVVIGQKAKRVSPKDAMQYVAGYTIVHGRRFSNRAISSRTGRTGCSASLSEAGSSGARIGST